MKYRFLAAVVGMVLAWPLMYWWPDPFVPRQHYYKAPQFSDAEKESFFATFIATFDAGNPHTEWGDMMADFPPEVGVLKKYYDAFGMSIKKLTSKTCSKKYVLRKSTEQNSEEAKDREFIIFDIETCTPITQGKK